MDRYSTSFLDGVVQTHQLFPGFDPAGFLQGQLAGFCCIASHSSGQFVPQSNGPFLLDMGDHTTFLHSLETIICLIVNPLIVSY